MAPIISVQGVSKHFRIPHEKHATILDHIAGTLALLGGRRYDYEEFWALKEINFNLAEHESLGIVGPNGSGKSTLLKLMAGVMNPDKGSIVTNGSLVPILELGIGFHGDLTVKENALVYGVIMGLSRHDVKERISSILDFAGLARFEDAPLKSLSSGMQVRLAFSIAIQTEAEIFLVDEALSVGDEAFQQRCVEKFRELKKENRSIVLVSHDLKLIDLFCEKALYLRAGEMKAYGESPSTTRRYLRDIEADRPSALTSATNRH